MSALDPRRYGADVVIGPPNAHTFTLELVGADRDVLELGCGAGGMTQAMSEIGCKVVAVEVDPVAAEHARPFADQVVIGDLVALDLAAELGEGRFDVIVMGDVLEHLVDPLQLLARTRRLLRPGGHVVLSVPNVAHGDVRLALLAGRFDYAPVGLLDATHVRFFTWSSLRSLLRDAGLVPLEVRRARLPLFATEIPLDPAAYDPSVVERIRADDDATTYQFVVRAVPVDEREELQALVERAEEAEAEVSRLRADGDRLTRRLDEVLDEVGRLRLSESEARLRLDVLTDKIRDIEGGAELAAAIAASRVVRWTRPVRHAARKLRRRSTGPPEAGL